MTVGGVHCFAGRRTVLFLRNTRCLLTGMQQYSSGLFTQNSSQLAQRLSTLVFCSTLACSIIVIYNSAVQKQGPHIHSCQLQLKQAWTKLKRFGCLDSLQLARASRLHACNYSSKAESKQGGCYVCIREGNQHSDQNIVRSN